MIYITGDCHGNWSRFSKNKFKAQKTMTRDDYVIVCGDFGIWSATESESDWLDYLNECNFTLLFVDGNHENFDRLYSDEFNEVDFHGGRAHKIRDNIYHLMRGYVFDICDKKIFAFGGASSHDISDGILDRNDYSSKEEFYNEIFLMTTLNKMFRINHQSWWKEELPSNEEMQRGLDNLSQCGNKVDFIISHCCPKSVQKSISDMYGNDILTEYFETIKDKTEYSKWYFGHYHEDREIDSKHQVLYHKIVKIAE